MKSEEIQESNLDPYQKLNNSKKLNLDIYVPLEACACQWSQFMNLVFTVITPYIKYIKHETKSLNSDEARKLNLHSNCIVIDGVKKYSSSYALKKDLPKLIKDKCMV